MRLCSENRKDRSSHNRSREEDGRRRYVYRRRWDIDARRVDRDEGAVEGTVDDDGWPRAGGCEDQRDRSDNCERYDECGKRRNIGAGQNDSGDCNCGKSYGGNFFREFNGAVRCRRRGRTSCPR